MGNMKDAILSSPCNNITHIYIKGYRSWWRRICRWLIILKWVHSNYSNLTLQSLPLLGKKTSGLFRPKNNSHQELLLYNLLLMLFTLWENDKYNTLNANLYANLAVGYLQHQRHIWGDYFIFNEIHEASQTWHGKAKVKVTQNSTQEPELSRRGYRLFDVWSYLITEFYARLLRFGQVAEIFLDSCKGYVIRLTIKQQINKSSFVDHHDFHSFKKHLLSSTFNSHYLHMYNMKDHAVAVCKNLFLLPICLTVVSPLYK